MIQRKTEWLHLKNGTDYHEQQFEKPYRSTEVFIDWLSGFFDGVKNGDIICDLACGEGANLLYMAQKYPNINFEGIEINNELVRVGNEKLKVKGGGERARIYEGDWYHLKSDLRKRYKGIISFQTLSWLPEYNEALRCMAELGADWIAISSLFYEGEIDYTIQLKDYTRSVDRQVYECYYNIYSLVRVKELFAELGYKKFEYKYYDIDIDLPKPEKDGLGTYTRKMEDGSRIQISAGLMLPWYFIVAYK